MSPPASPPAPSLSWGQQEDAGRMALCLLGGPWGGCCGTWRTSPQLLEGLQPGRSPVAPLLGIAPPQEGHFTWEPAPFLGWSASVISPGVKRARLLSPAPRSRGMWSRLQSCVWGQRSPWLQMPLRLSFCPHPPSPASLPSPGVGPPDYRELQGGIRCSQAPECEPEQTRRDPAPVGPSSAGVMAGFVRSCPRWSEARGWSIGSHHVQG